MLSSLLLLTLYVLASSARSEDVVANTPQGALRGRRANFGGVNVSHFLGVPYGKSSRFQPAVPAGKWSGIRDAKHFPPICPQLEKSVLPSSEDCLYLNIYAPEPEDPKKLLPVMVFIHGGGFRSGTASYYNGTALAARGVVLVTINYRLDVLGFLSTGDMYGCPGNLGLQDQLLALKWVNKSIASFHGNASDVTIFGESAGSASVSLLRLSPLSTGLFSKVIMESGSSLSPWAITKDPVKWSMQLGNIFGCGENSTTNLVSCLMGQSVDKLLAAAQSLDAKNGGSNLFAPVVEQNPGVLPFSPIEMLHGGNGSDIITLRGVNKDEGSFFILDTPLSNFTKTQVESNVAGLAAKFYPRDPEGAKAAILKEYFPNIGSATEEENRLSTVQLMTDFDFVAPTVLETKLVLNASRWNRTAPQYLYHYTYRPTHFNRPRWAGVPHGSELPIVFGQPFVHDRFADAIFPFPWSAQDAAVSSDVMTMWTNFAKYGSPTPQSLSHVTPWPTYTLDKEQYLEITNPLSVQAHLKEERMNFWERMWYDRT